MKIADKMGTAAGTNSHRRRMPIKEAPMEQNTCIFPQCERIHYGIGLCQPHYLQNYRGSELKPLRIKWDNRKAKIEHYLKPDENGCWIWQLSLTTAGYGRVQWKGTLYLVHRYYLIDLGLEVPDDMDVDHLCMVKACANPDHLEVVTHAENMRRYGEARKCG